MKTSLIIAFTLAAAAAHATPLTTVLNASSVSISGIGSYRPESGRVSATYSESSAATMEAPFEANISGSAVMDVYAGPFPTTTFARSSASQDSRVASGHIEARGGVSTRANGSSEELYFLQYSSSAAASSTFDLIFQISTPTLYHLDGFIERGWWDQDLSRLSLAVLGGQSLLQLQLDGRSGFAAFDLTGLLEPGTYRLTALAQADSSGARSESDTGYAGFSFTADFAPAAVPEAGATLGLLALGFGGLIGLRRAPVPNVKRCSAAPQR